jgi:hypothetical protein
MEAICVLACVLEAGPRHERAPQVVEGDAQQARPRCRTVPGVLEFPCRPRRAQLVDQIIGLRFGAPRRALLRTSATGMTTRLPVLLWVNLIALPS